MLQFMLHHELKNTVFSNIYLAKNPLTGSIWLAVRSHLKLWCNCKFVVLHVAWDIVPETIENIGNLKNKIKTIT